MTGAVLVAITVAVLLVVLYLAAWRLRRPVRPQIDAMPPKAPTIAAGSSGPAAAAEDEYRALVTMVLGDRAKAERFVSNEAQQAPGAGRLR